MFARYFRVIVLALALAASAQDPVRREVCWHTDTAKTDAEPASGMNTTITSYFGDEVRELCTEADVLGLKIDADTPTCDIASELPRGVAPSPEVWGLLEASRFAFQPERPRELKIDVTSEKFFNAASQSYIMKHISAVPLPGSDAVILKMQANETTFPGSSAAFPFLNDCGVITSGALGFEAKFLDHGKDHVEIALGYSYDSSRSHGSGASLKYHFPELFAPIHLYATPEIQVNADGSNQEKVSLAVWSDFPAGGRTPPRRLTATVGIRRQDLLSRRYFHESYSLDWGALLKLTERLSTGLKMSYSWDDHGLATIFYMELKAPAGAPRGSQGGVYGPGTP
jgi:hypothetical protein